MKKKRVLPCSAMGACVYAGRIKIGRHKEIIGICTASKDNFNEKPPCPVWADGRSWKDSVEVFAHVKKEW